MADKNEIIRASADALRNAIVSGDRRSILLAARDHAATMLQHSTSARDTPALLKQITDITDELAKDAEAKEPDRFDELMAGFKW